MRAFSAYGFVLKSNIDSVSCSSSCSCSICCLYPALIVWRVGKDLWRSLLSTLWSHPALFLPPLTFPPSSSPSLFLCNWSSSPHFKPKHVCLAPKQTRPPLSPLFILPPLPHQTPFPIQRDDVMPMLRKTTGLRTCCVCLYVCICGWRAAMGWGVMGVVGDVVRLFFKLPNNDLRKLLGQ